MKPRFLPLIAAFFVFSSFKIFAATYYVDLNCTNPTPPYADWSTAATNIQDAVDASTNGDLILVTNGIYQTGGHIALPIDPDDPDFLSNRVAVTKPVTIQSVNGPAVTIIQGYQVPGTTNGSSAMRCVYLTNNATLIGFTLTNGATTQSSGISSGNGGGVRCESTNAVVSNCVLVGNSAIYGGGALSGTLNNCIFSNNVAQVTGGGIYGGILNNCLLTGNSASLGGAVAIYYNIPPTGFNNYTILNNCTIYGNSASVAGGGLDSEGAGAPSYLYVSNCIVFGNTSPSGSNYSFVFAGEIKMNHCCTIPLPSSGIGNFTNNPLFINPNAGDFHLQSNSPCINSGNNLSVTTTNDLDGNPRIVGGTVDIGAYEYQTPTSIISYAWLQQYGLATDGSADFIDSDGDGMNNWQEWIAGTDPTNALSVLEMLSPTATNNPSGLVVTWQSVSARAYYLQSSTNLAAQPAFSTIQSNIIGRAGATSFTDTSATNGGPYFYRVGVQ